MLKVAFIIYRSWGYRIFREILDYQKTRQDFKVSLLITTHKPEFKLNSSSRKKIQFFQVNPKEDLKIYEILKKNDIKIAFFYSWSNIIDKKIIKDFICLCLHPSMLPNYRGGTPIQHQLINGEINSGITVFKMNDVIDGGDIYQQTAMSLVGNISDIFNRMSELGSIITKNLIADYLNKELFFKPQKNLKNKPIFKRRKPEQSEIRLSQIKKMKYIELHNLVRGLMDPYPNVYIKFADRMLYIQEIAKYRCFLDNKKTILNDCKSISGIDLKGKKLFFKMKDGLALVVKHEIGSLSSKLRNQK